MFDSIKYNRATKLASKCQAKDPRLCPYHGAQTNMAKAIANKDYTAYEHIRQHLEWSMHGENKKQRIAYLEQQADQQYERREQLKKDEEAAARREAERLAWRAAHPAEAARMDEEARQDRIQREMEAKIARAKAAAEEKIRKQNECPQCHGSGKVTHKRTETYTENNLAIGVALGTMYFPQSKTRTIEEKRICTYCGGSGQKRS